MLAQIKKKLVDYTTPVFSCFRNPKTAYKEDGKFDNRIKKDIISAGRAKQLLKREFDNFPKDIFMMQQFLPSADLTPVPQSIIPNMSKVSNTSMNYEVFEVVWDASHDIQDREP